MQIVDIESAGDQEGPKAMQSDHRCSELEANSPHQQYETEDEATFEDPISAALPLDLRLQLQDERDAFVCDYGELEQEVFDLRSYIGDLQHQVDTANRRWSHERELKMELERQLMCEGSESDQPFKQQAKEPICAPLSVHNEEPAEPERQWSTSDSGIFSAQPCTPSAEDGEGPVHRCNTSVSSSCATASPELGAQEEEREERDNHLDLALEAQVALAKLKEEHRNVIVELVEAKLLIANLRSAGQELKLSRKDRGDVTHLSTAGGAALARARSIGKQGTMLPGSSDVAKRKGRGWFNRGN